ncbi:MAG: hypothetical protein H0T53_14985 [Herpetosiphonaceae bacterium]|nr:hypothetical protein [Herpetosiphonaceae bacterium]
MEATQRTHARQFVEKVGLLYEQVGLQRMAGRILGWLLICDPPAQSAADLAAALDASKGSISGITRQLFQPVHRQRLETMRNIYGFFERELPALLERWHADKQGAADAVSSN